MDEKRKMQEILNHSLSGLKENPFLSQRVIAQAKGEEPVKKKLSGVKDNPWLAQRIMNRADEEEPIVKKKLSFGIVLVIVAVLVLGTALAVALNTVFFQPCIWK